MVVLQSKHVPPSAVRLSEGHTIKAEGCDAAHLDVTPRVVKIGQRPGHKIQGEKTHLAKQPGSWSEYEGILHLMHALDMCWQTKARWQQEFVCFNMNITNNYNFIPFPSFFEVLNNLWPLRSALQNQNNIFSNFLKIDIKFWFFKYFVHNFSAVYLDAFHIIFLKLKH